MSNKSVAVHDGEYYVDMSKRPQKTIWEAAKINNAKPKVVRHHNCKDASYFMGC